VTDESLENLDIWYWRSMENFICLNDNFWHSKSI